MSSRGFAVHVENFDPVHKNILKQKMYTKVCYNVKLQIMIQSSHRKSAKTQRNQENKLMYWYYIFLQQP